MQLLSDDTTHSAVLDVANTTPLICVPIRLNFNLKHAFQDVVHVDVFEVLLNTTVRRRDDLSGLYFDRADQRVLAIYIHQPDVNFVVLIFSANLPVCPRTFALGRIPESEADDVFSNPMLVWLVRRQNDPPRSGAIKAHTDVVKRRPPFTV
eukprot:scaffold1748_cov258-Pinguiococcus_pyrenoidosus.AAC.26